MAASLQSARNLFVQLREVFRFVAPSIENKNVYGDQIRSLLILASTEVESAWKTILIANNGATAGDRLTTKDYVRLCEPLRLHPWKVKLPGFPDYGAIAPFASWDKNTPTASLHWYDAYNERALRPTLCAIWSQSPRGLKSSDYRNWGTVFSNVGGGRILRSVPRLRQRLRGMETSTVLQVPRS
jgi:hypothetical protein